MAESKTSGSSLNARASVTRKVAVRPRSAAFHFAIVIGSARKSMPVTFWPRAAAYVQKRPGDSVGHVEEHLLRTGLHMPDRPQVAWACGSSGYSSRSRFWTRNAWA